MSTPIAHHIKVGGIEGAGRRGRSVVSACTPTLTSPVTGTLHAVLSLMKSEEIKGSMVKVWI